MISKLILTNNWYYTTAYITEKLPLILIFVFFLYFILFLSIQKIHFFYLFCNGTHYGITKSVFNASFFIVMFVVVRLILHFRVKFMCERERLLSSSVTMMFNGYNDHLKFFFNFPLYWFSQNKIPMPTNKGTFEYQKKKKKTNNNNNESKKKKERFFNTFLLIIYVN